MIVIQTTVSPVFHYFSCHSKLEDQKRAAFNLMHSWRYPGSFLRFVRAFSACWIDFLKSVSIAHDDLPVSEPVQSEQFGFTCELKHSYPFCGTFPECDDCDLPVNEEPFAPQIQSDQDLIIPAELPVIDEPLGQAQCWICPHCHDDAYHKSDENGCEWQTLNTVLDDFVDWFKSCPYQRSMSDKRLLLNNAIESISAEFNLTPPQSKNYFWGVRQRLGLLP